MKIMMFFWILKCTSELYVYRDDEKKTCAYKQSIGKGDDIVEGFYYKKSGRLNTLCPGKREMKELSYFLTPRVLLILLCNRHHINKMEALPYKN